MANHLMDASDTAEKLAQVALHLRGDGFEKSTSRLNKVLRRIGGAWLLIEPGTGALVSGALLASDLLDDLLQGLSSATQGDVNRVFHEVLGAYELRIEEVERLLGLLIPKAGVVFNHGEWRITEAHGISSVADQSSRELELFFCEVLTDPDAFIAHCNVVGTRLQVHERGVSILLPENYDPMAGLVKVVLQRVTGF